jgi:hypothetical protein
MSKRRVGLPESASSGMYSHCSVGTSMTVKLMTSQVAEESGSTRAEEPAVED